MFHSTACLFWWIHKDSKLFFWDEYSHWGMFIKHMFYTDKLYDLGSNEQHLRYLPGTTLIQYLFTRNFEFSEGSVYFAQFMMILVPSITFFDYLKNQKLLNYIFLILILVLVSCSRSWDSKTLRRSSTQYLDGSFIDSSVKF